MLVACDKFKGTATSTAINAVVVAVAREVGLDAQAITLSDGGDGLLDVFGGPNRRTPVTGPLGVPVAAPWRHDNDGAVIESALASGLELVERNDPIAASSRGTGELLEAAIREGARRVMVGLGGSACTDGGLGAVDALTDSTIRALAVDVDLVVCCDVTTRYLDAATVFGPQKGATPDDIVLLTDRLRAAARTLGVRFGVDVTDIVGGGAAGGLGGALAALGGRLRPGFDVVAKRVGLAALIARVDLVVTGEGRLDESSFAGKVVGGVAQRARAAGVPVIAIVGDAEPGFQGRLELVSCSDLVGRDRAMADVLGSVERAAREVLSRRRSG